MLKTKFSMKYSGMFKAKDNGKNDADNKENHNAIKKILRLIA